MTVILTCSVVFLLDFFIKQRVELLFVPYHSIPVVKNILQFTLVHNTGTALGLFQGNNTLFAVVSFVSIVVCAYLFAHYGRKDLLSRLCSGAILGGAFSNVYDRFSAGYVIDYLDFRIWPVFNLSDACITMGFAVLVWKSFFQNRSPVQKAEVR